MSSLAWVTSNVLLKIPGVHHGMSTRLGGVSASPYDSLNLGLHVGDDPTSVVENRRRACQDLGFSLEDWVSGEQVHGTRVAVVTRSDRGRGAYAHNQSVPGVDGLVTDDPGVLLSGYYADCVPLFVVDPAGPRIAIGHAGWRGTLGNIAASLVGTFVEAYGSGPQNLRVWIGPSIGPCCFEIGAQLADAFAAKGLGRYIRRSERVTIDLWRVNAHLLIQQGVKSTNIEVSSRCTMCDTQRFFSHRACGPHTGRLAGFIGILE